MKKASRKTVLAALLAVLLLALAACGQKPVDSRIVGTWRVNMTDDAMSVIAGPIPLLNAASCQYEITFREDGTCTATMLEGGRETTISSNYSGSGTFSFENGRLRIGSIDGSFDCAIDGDVMTWTCYGLTATFYRR